MPLKDLIKKSKDFELQSFKKHLDPKELRKKYLPYTGSPKKHSYDHKKVILLIEPYINNTEFYEIKTADIFHIEELPNITNIDGETVTMVRIWVKKGSIAIRCTPFIVEDINI